MKAFVTKFLFTRGIIETDVIPLGAWLCDAPALQRSLFRRDWSKTRAEAVARAREMIAAKRKAIAKQLAAMEKVEESLGGDA